MMIISVFAFMKKRHDKTVPPPRRMIFNIRPIFLQTHFETEVSQDSRLRNSLAGMRVALLQNKKLRGAFKAHGRFRHREWGRRGREDAPKAGCITIQSSWRNKTHGLTAHSTNTFWQRKDSRTGRLVPINQGDSPARLQLAYRSSEA